MASPPPLLRGLAALDFGLVGLGDDFGARRVKIPQSNQPASPLQRKEGGEGSPECHFHRLHRFSRCFLAAVQLLKCKPNVMFGVAMVLQGLSASHARLLMRTRSDLHRL